MEIFSLPLILIIILQLYQNTADYMLRMFPSYRVIIFFFKR